MAGRKKQYKAVAPIQVTTAGVVDGDGLVINLARLHGNCQLRFDKWLGKGIDPWVQAVYQQLRAFVQGKTMSMETVHSYSRGGISVFLDYLISTGATYGPGEVNSQRIAQFIEWLETTHKSKKPASRKAIYDGVKAVLKGWARRGIIPHGTIVLPPRQLQKIRHSKYSEQPLSQNERIKLAEALRADIIALHQRPQGMSDADALVVYALALCLRTGMNTAPMLELKRDALTRHPFFPKMGLLTIFKRRGHRIHRMTLAAQSSKVTTAVPVDAVALFNKLLERTRSLAESGPHELRSVLWLYRPVSTAQYGEVCRLRHGNLAHRIQAFVQRHNLRDDNGGPLRLNNRRLRVTMENRLWKLSNGDLFTVASLMGHQPIVADQHYLAVTAEMRAHARIVGEALPDIYKGTVVATDGAPPTLGITPVGRCKDSLHGELAPKDGVNHCVDFLSCFRCRSYAVVGSSKDLHRLFSFYWFLDAERERIPSPEWQEYFTYVLSLIDRFTRDKFDRHVVGRAKAKAKAEPLGFWKNYQFSYRSGAGQNAR